MELLNNKKLSIDDLSYLNELLKSGITLDESLLLLRTKKNERIFDSLKERLINGQMIEEAIEKYLPKEIKEYLIPFSKTLSFSNALDLSLSFYRKQKDNEGLLMSNSLYPFLLLFISVTALYFFDLYGLDSIFNLLISFSLNIDFYITLRKIVRVVIYIFYYGLLLVVIVVFYMTRYKRKTLSYILLCRFKDNILQQYYCGEMVSLFLECLKNGYKTKQCLELLRALISKPIVSFLAFHLDESLLAGDSLKEATSQGYYDSLLSGYIKIASLTNHFEQYLENYVFLNQKKIRDKIKRYTIILQGSVYGLIGMVIIFVYQIMLMPMQAIINF